MMRKIEIELENRWERKVRKRNRKVQYSTVPRKLIRKKKVRRVLGRGRGRCK